MQRTEHFCEQDIPALGALFCGLTEDLKKDIPNTSYLSALDTHNYILNCNLFYFEL